MKMRLDRWLSTLAVGSRSEVKEGIRKGLAQVNGLPVRDAGAVFEPGRDHLRYAGKDLDGRIMRHVMLHKPAGLLTAARDKKQPTVMDLLPPLYRGIGCMPVGRLDKDTTGLLLLTCDGELNHRLLSPGRHVEKHYRARVQGRPGPEDVAAFAQGLDLGDFIARPARLILPENGRSAESYGATGENSLAEPTGETSWADVVLTEGRFHQVKRMFAVVGHEVLSLKRLAFGPLQLDPGLAPGDWRELTTEEVSALYQAAGMVGPSASADEYPSVETEHSEEDR